MLANLVKELYKWKDDTRLLDFGCGTHGSIAKGVCELTAETVGVDSNEQAIAEFNKDCTLQGLLKEEVRGIHASSFFSDSIWQGYFDICVASLVYHHLENPAETTAMLFKQLKPGGKIIIIDLYRKEGIRGFTEAELEALLENAGFRDVSVKTGPAIRLRRVQVSTRLLIAQAFR